MLALDPEPQRPRRRVSAAPAPALDLSALQASRPGITVLLVDDDTLVRRRLVMLLEALGYDVLQAASAEEALDLAERSEQRIDLLLTDVFMPGLDGFELAVRLRRFLPGARALVMTGYAQDALLKGFVSEVLVKPFDLHELVDALRRTLG